jgi:rubrerythrin
VSVDKVWREIYGNVPIPKARRSAAEDALRRSIEEKLRAKAERLAAEDALRRAIEERIRDERRDMDVYIQMEEAAKDLGLQKTADALRKIREDEDVHYRSLHLLLYSIWKAHGVR